MAKTKTKTRKRSGRSTGRKTSVTGIILDTAIAIGSLLGTQALSKMLVKKDEDKNLDIAGSGLMPLIPSLIGAGSPFFLRSPYSKSISIGSSISLIMTLVSVMDAKAEKEGKRKPGTKTLYETLFLAGNGEDEAWDMSDLSPEQQAILSQYALTLSGNNVDPLGNDPYVMTGKSDPYVMTGDNTDPLS